MMTFEKISSILLTGCAAVVTALLVKRETVGEASRLGRAASEQGLKQDARFSSISAVAREIRHGDRAMAITVFTDVECPFCGRFHKKLDSLQARLSAPVTVRYIHFPLSIHKFAALGAGAAECAAGQQRFPHFLNAVFSQQDSIGLLPWTKFAQKAGVADLEKFEDCLASPPSKLVGYGLRAGQKLGVTGTPTVFLDDFRFKRPPTLEELELAIEQRRAGRQLHSLKFADE